MASSVPKRSSAPVSTSTTSRTKKKSVPRESWHLIVHGTKLRRTSYRDWLYDVAEEQKLAGWVRNYGDDAVEALIRGRKRRIGTLIGQLEEGPIGAKVVRVEYRRSEVVPHAGMRVRADREDEHFGAATPSFFRRTLSRLRKTRSGSLGAEPPRTPTTPGPSGTVQSMGTEQITTEERQTNAVVSATRARLQLGPGPDRDGGMTLEALANLLGGQWAGDYDGRQLVGGGSFLIDRLPEKAVLFAMDDHGWSERLRRSSRQIRWKTQELIQTAAARGAVAAVSCEHIPDSPIPVHVVPDTRQAMWKFAYFARSHYKSPVVGITGTVGKSTTTSLLSYVLSQGNRVHSTDGNWNTIDGVANTLSGLMAPTDVAVVEAAISGFVRVPEHSSAAMLQPDVAVITAIGSAHLDIAPTIEDTARIKGKLLEDLRPGGVAILNADAPHFEYLEEVARQAGAASVLSFGRSPSADYRLIDWTIDGDASLIRVRAEGRALSYRMRSIGEGVAFNSLGTLAAARALGCSIEDATGAFEQYVAKEGVSTLHELSVDDGTALLIDDSTNATVISMNAAIELLGKFAAQRQGRAVAVLGQINFLGEQASRIHASLAEPLKKAGVQVVLTTGGGMDELMRELGSDCYVSHSETPRQLVDEVRSVLQPGDVVLVKGSSANTGFKRVARSLLRSGQR